MPILTHDPSRFVQVRNNSDHLQVIRDPMVPGGVIRFAAGEEALISKDVYRRVFRRAATWMVNVDSETIRADAPARESEPPVPDGTGEADPPADEPTYTHLYKGLPACVLNVEGEGEEEMLTIAVGSDKTPRRTVKRSTWEANATPLVADPPADETQ